MNPRVRTLCEFAVWLPLGFVLAVFGLALWQTLVVAFVVGVQISISEELRKDGSYRRGAR